MGLEISKGEGAKKREKERKKKTGLVFFYGEGKGVVRQIKPKRCSLREGG